MGLRGQKWLKNVPDVTISSDKLVDGAKISQKIKGLRSLSFQIITPLFYPVPLISNFVDNVKNRILVKVMWKGQHIYYI